MRAKFVPVRRTMSTIGIGSPSTRSGPTAGGIFQSKGSPKRPTGTSSNAGLGITASTSSRVWPQRSRLLRSSKRSWSESYENLVDSDTRVDVNTGIVAAGRLQSLIDSRRRSTSARTPSMMPTTSPSIRPSSSTRTTSFDLRSAHRHRGHVGPGVLAHTDQHVVQRLMRAVQVGGRGSH